MTDVGEKLFCIVTAHNAYGSGVAHSNVVGPVATGYPTSAESDAFIARTSGLDATHTEAYHTLITGLVDDGVWAKLDVLYIFATQNSTTALLNLVSSSNTATTAGSPAFVADRGFTGVEASTTVYIDTNYNPLVGPLYVLNSAHMSVWCNIDTTSDGIFIGSFVTGVLNQMAAKYASFSNASAAQMHSAPSAGAGFTDSNSIGHYIGSRSGSTALALYKNGVSVGTAADASIAIPNKNLHVLARGVQGGTSDSGTNRQIAMASAGAHLAGLELAYYNRLHTYMTAVGNV